MYQVEIQHGEGSDYFTGHVIDNISGKQVAVLRKEFDEIEYTRQIYCLGKYYNEALIGLENNFSTYPTNKLEELGYKKQFVREVEDTYTNKFEKRLGFKTTSVTRPLVLANLHIFPDMRKFFRIILASPFNPIFFYVLNGGNRLPVCSLHLDFSLPSR